MYLFSDAGVDYIPPEGIFRFSAGEKEDCFDIEILDDEFLEPLETFTVSLMPTESLGNEIVFSRDTIVVRIIDRDGKVLVYFWSMPSIHANVFFLQWPMSGL